MSRLVLIGIALAALHGAAHAQSPAPSLPTPAAAVEAIKNEVQKRDEPLNKEDVKKPEDAPPPQPAPSIDDFGLRKSYSVPAWEILGFDFLLNRINRKFSGVPDYNNSVSSTRANLRGKWVTDNDPYSTNQFGHPYQGSMYHGFARSAGLNYWESAAYTFGGSILWELAGENTPPSKNDQVASGIAGSFLGESLFRMASLVLEHGGDVPQFWREVSAAAISPSTGFNRLAFGDRFGSVFSSRGASYYSRFQLGLSHATKNQSGTSTHVKPNEALADYSMEYGLPGKPGYEYDRPFDYFTFQATASSANIFENIMTKGLLAGRSYEGGEFYRGVAGLFGSYDYISPQSFRVSSTALSLGTVGQFWATHSVALQGTALAGVGYAAVGTLHGAGEGDYHYGVTPQALLALRVIFGDKASLDITGREYFVSKAGSGTGTGHDNIVRGEVGFTWRLQKQHGVALRYVFNRRDASYSTLGDRTQERGTIGIFYTYMGLDRFGATEWR